MTAPKKNSAASIHQRLLHVAKTRGHEFQQLLTRFAIERLLVRLDSTAHRDDFILKGAMLFALWAEEPHRPTMDLDLLARGSPDLERLRSVFAEVCAVERDDDAIRFEGATIRVAPIREDAVYEGVRVRIAATLGKARIPVQVDVGFGDATVPRPLVTEYPTLLGLSTLRIKAYARETVIAEKTEAMVTLGIANSRMKDFFDLWFLAQNFEFDGARLAAALGSTFRRRQIAIPDGVPLALTPEFAADAAKMTQWRAFVAKSRLRSTPPPFAELIAILNQFLVPPLGSLRADRPFSSTWAPAGPWRSPPVPAREVS